MNGRGREINKYFPTTKEIIPCPGKELGAWVFFVPWGKILKLLRYNYNTRSQRLPPVCISCLPYLAVRLQGKDTLF